MKALIRPALFVAYIAAGHASALTLTVDTPLDQLNTPSVVFAGKLIARVGLATNKPAEFIILRISQDTRALEAELAAAGA